VSKWKKFLGLSPLERRMLVRACLMLPLARCALRWVGFRRCRAVFVCLAGSRCDSGSERKDLAQAMAIARMVAVASGLEGNRTRCLPQSLVLWYLLQKRRLHADMWLGVRKDETGVNAHAWIEYAGAVLNDREDVRQQFAAFKSILSAHC
jgi:hypothetical protein